MNTKKDSEGADLIKRKKKAKSALQEPISAFERQYNVQPEPPVSTDPALVEKDLTILTRTYLIHNLEPSWIDDAISIGLWGRFGYRSSGDIICSFLLIASHLDGVEGSKCKRWIEPLRENRRVRGIYDPKRKQWILRMEEGKDIKRKEDVELEEWLEKKRKSD